MTDLVAYRNIIPLVSPADIGASGSTTGYVDLFTAQRAVFYVFFGSITSSTGTDVAGVALQCATAEGGTEAALGYSYRLSAAVGANTWGAVTTVGTTGFEAGLTTDDMILAIEVDPDVLAANEYRFARLVVSGDLNALEIAIWAEIFPRYMQTTHTSVTASASA